MRIRIRPCRWCAEPPARDVPESRCPLGTRPADRHEGRVDGLLPRRGDDLGIDVPPTGTYPHYYFKPMEPWLKDFDASTPANGRSSRTTRPSASRSPTCCVPRWATRSLPTRTRSPPPSVGAGGNRTPRRPRSSFEKAGFRSRRRRGMPPDGKPVHHPHLGGRRHRPVMTRAGSMIAQQWRSSASIQKSMALPTAMWSNMFNGQTRSVDGLDGRDLGRPPRPVVLPRFLALGVPVAAPGSFSRRATGSAGGPRTRQDHRGRSAPSASTIPRASSSASTPEAGREEHADHPADVVQRVHGHGHDLLDRISRAPRPTPTLTRCPTGPTRST